MSDDQDKKAGRLNRDALRDQLGDRQKSEMPKREHIRSAVGRKSVASTADELAAASLAAETEHVVASGESLSVIAQNYYGSANDWPRIYQANKALIGDNPDRIRVGQKLKIPAKK
jgi:nucleoid-associated protein YgaU